MTEKSVTEASNDFYLEFKSEYQAIDVDIEKSNTILKSTLSDHFKTILQRINNLEKNLTRATEFIPSYDERQYFMQLKELNLKLQTAKDELTPKAKFSFKSRKKKTPTVTKEEEEKVEAPQLSLNNVLSDATVLFKDEENTVLTLTGKTNKKSIDILLSNIKNCIVVLQDNDIQISAIHMKQVENSVIYANQVDGSVLMYGIKDSTLFLACHQLRMHEARHINMLLHVTSRPIIEDSNQISVGAWDINTATNFYDQLEDFNWLKKQASPNWSLMDPVTQKSLLDKMESIKHSQQDEMLSNKASLLP